MSEFDREKATEKWRKSAGISRLELESLSDRSWTNPCAHPQELAAISLEVTAILFNKLYTEARRIRIRIPIVIPSFKLLLNCLDGTTDCLTGG
jgi:hypothetical protein